MDKMMILTALLVLVLAAAAFQAFELAGVKAGLEKFKAPAAVAAQAPAAPVPQTAGGLNGLPNMVGGC